MIPSLVPKVRMGTTPLEQKQFDIEFLSRKRLCSDILEDDTCANKEDSVLSQKKTVKITEPFSNIKDQLLIRVVCAAFKKLRNATFFRKINDLNVSQIELFGDQAFYNEPKKEKKCFSIRFSNFLSIAVINPFNSIKMAWNLLNFAFFLILLFLVPFEVSFGSFFDSSFVISLYSISFILLFFDILIKMNTAIFIKGCQIRDRTRILKNYMKNSFLLDFLSCIGVIYGIKLGGRAPNGALIQVPKLLVFLKVPQFISLYYEILQYFRMFNKKFKSILDLWKLLMVSLFLAHITACLWHSCSMIAVENGKRKSWLLNYGNDSWSERYLLSLYWAVVTMMTVGYGDIVPLNNLEIIFAIAAILAGCAVYAYNLSSIGMILQEIYREDQEFNERISIINHFMEQKNIDKDLNMRVREYLKFLWSEKIARRKDEELEIINSLNEHLKEELLLEAYGGMFKAFPMFFHNFSQKSLKETLGVMRELRFMPGDVIYNQGELDDCSIFYINDGEVDIIVEGSKPERKTTLKTLKAGQVFGEFSFFTGQSRVVSTRSKVFSNVFEVKRGDFIRILQSDRNDYDQFCMIKDELLFNGKTSAFKSRCLTCDRSSHSLGSCNYFHFIPNREKIVKKLEFSQPQERVKFKRKNFIKINARGIRKKCVLQAKILMKNLRSIKQKPAEPRLFDTERSSFFSIEDTSLNSVQIYFGGVIDHSNESLSHINMETETHLPGHNSPSEQIELKEIHHIPLPPTFDEESINRPEEKQSKSEEKHSRSDERKKFTKIKSKKINSLKSEGESLFKRNMEKSEIMQRSAYMKDFLERDFEKAHIFEKYFPEENIDACVKKCEKNKRKRMIMKRVQSGTYRVLGQLGHVTSEMRIIEEIDETLKNLEKYSFYPDRIRFRISRYMRKKGKGFQKKRSGSYKVSIGSQESFQTSKLNRQSVFFKRQEFKSKHTFSSFVDSVISLSKIKKKRNLSIKLQARNAN